jgi:trimeric autotransporter adhesin
VVAVSPTNPATYFQLVFTPVANLSAPLVTTGEAGPIQPTRAEFGGTVTPNNLDTAYWFEYGTDVSYGSDTATNTVSGSDTGPVPVSTPFISGLMPSTTYHVQLFGSNSAGSSGGGDMTFTTPAEPPDAVVFSTGASNVTSTTAQLTGTVNPEGTVLAGYFEWGTTTAYGNDTTNFYDVTQNFQEVNESTTLSNLSPNTTYHYQIVAYNSGPDEALGGDVTFTTSAPSQQALPAVTTGSAYVFDNEEVLNGTVNPNGDPATTAWVEYGTNTGYGTSTPHVPVGGGNAPVNFAAYISLSYLLPNTTYHWRADGANTGGTAHGADSTFTTGAASPQPPTVQTYGAVDVTNNSATLAGQVNPNGLDTHYYFQYGLDTNYGSATETNDIGSGDSGITVEYPLNFNSSTMYHYRVVAYNSAGTSYGADSYFTTSGAPVPTVSSPFTDEVNMETNYDVYLVATVNPMGLDTHVYFQYGTTTNYGSATNWGDLGNGSNYNTNAIAVSLYALDFTPVTTYHFRAVAYNSAGPPVYGPDATFYTGAPAVITMAATNIGSTSATLNMTINPNGDTNTTASFIFLYEYGEYSASQPTAVGGSPTNFSVTVSNLAPGTVYDFEAVGNNTYGSGYGGALEFTTQ